MEKYDVNSLPEFPKVFPPSIQQFADDYARSLGCNKEFISMSILVVVATVIGNGARLRIKSDWVLGCVLYAMIVGEPGSKKTPAIAKALGPLFKLQKKFQQEYMKLIKDDPETHHEMKCIFTTDATMEGLTELLYQNRRGVLLYKDEGIGLIKAANQYKGGKGDDQEKFLSFWSQSDVLIKRKGKGSVFLDLPFLCFIGGIQVDVLESLSSMKDNGFIDRLLFSFPTAIEQMYSDFEVSHEVSKEYEDVIEFIFLSYQGVCTELVLSPTAKVIWNAWMTVFTERQNDAALPYYMKNSMSKFGGYTARFALVLEILNSAHLGVKSNYVSDHSVESAIKLTEYFLANYQKVRNSFGVSAIDKKVDNCVAWLKKQRSGTTTSRKLYSNRVAGVKNAQEAYDLIVEMRSRNLGRMDIMGDGLGGNQRSYTFTLNSMYLNSNRNAEAK